MKEVQIRSFAFAPALTWRLRAPVNRQFKPVRQQAWTRFWKPTIQVLLNVGKERLTTTSVALRAGVVGRDLVSILPEKSALLQAALKRQSRRSH